MTTKIKIMRQAGRILDEVLRQAVRQVKPGMSLWQIDQIIEAEILKRQASPGFKTVKGYNWASCLNINHGLVHGIPSKEVKVREGYLITIDAGVLFQGYHADKAVSFYLTEHGPSFKSKFLQAGIKALRLAINKVKAGGSIGEIAKALDQTISKYGYRVVPELSGHGLGRDLHEEPTVPQYYQAGYPYPSLAHDQTIAIEVIYTQGSPEFVTAKDGWTLETKDKKPAAMFEESVAATQDGYTLLTADSIEATCLQ